jgi:hypothetical protein
VPGRESARSYAEYAIWREVTGRVGNDRLEIRVTPVSLQHTDPTGCVKRDTTLL